MREREQGSEEQAGEGAHASPPPAPSRQGDGEEAGTAPVGQPREGQGKGVRYDEDRTAGYGAAGSADGERAREEPESNVHKINHGDKLDSIVPRRGGNQ